MFSAAETLNMLAGHAPTIQTAHQRLIASGYSLIGFHGCGLLDARRIVPDKFDPGQAGANTGGAGALARGRGFYIGAYRGKLAHNWSLIRQGKGFGAATILRIYAKSFSGMRAGIDYTWGAMDGINLRGASLAEVQEPGVAGAFAGESMAENHRNLEMTIHPCAYGRLIAIPSLGPADQALLTVQERWRSREAGDELPRPRSGGRFSESPF